MEISNPIASQYITNQGLTSQLNDNGKQLPVKSSAIKNEVISEEKSQLKQKQNNLGSNKSNQQLSSSDNSVINKPDNNDSNKLESSISTEKTAAQLLKTNPRSMQNSYQQHNSSKINSLSSNYSNIDPKNNSSTLNKSKIEKYIETSQVTAYSATLGIDIYT